MLRKDISVILTKSLKNINKFPKISCFAAGTLLKFCFCKGTCFPILLIPAFAILLYFIRIAQRKREAFGLGYCFGLGYFFFTLYWIAESFKCIGLGNYGSLAVIVLVLYISIYPALSCLFARCLAFNQTTLIIWFSIFWVLAEYVRGFLFTGFPWNLIGYATYDIPYFAQIADILGVYGVSFLAILIVALLTMRQTQKYSIVIFILVCLYGVYKIHFDTKYLKTKEKIQVVLVQPSILQKDKMDARKFKSNIYKQIGLSLRKKSKLKLYGANKLIVWHEAAINAPQKFQAKTLKYISSAVCDLQTTLITGCDKYDSENNPYNSVYVVGQDGKIEQTYDKRHLLPFGEYIPEFLNFFGIRKLTKGAANFKQGSLPRTINLAGTKPFDVVICYEIAFSGEVMDNPKSTWILNITNDAWFGNSDGPSQHLKIACFRAIEEGKSIARCANNGVSCIINCNGKIQKKLHIDKIGVISEYMPLSARKTIFSSCKNKTLFSVLAVLAMLVIALKRVKLRQKNIGREERI